MLCRCRRRRCGVAAPAAGLPAGAQRGDGGGRDHAAAAAAPVFDLCARAARLPGWVRCQEPVVLAGSWAGSGQGTRCLQPRAVPACLLLLAPTHPHLPPCRRLPSRPGVPAAVCGACHSGAPAHLVGRLFHCGCRARAAAGRAGRPSQPPVRCALGGLRLVSAGEAQTPEIDAPMVQLPAWQPGEVITQMAPSAAALSLQVCADIGLGRAALRPTHLLPAAAVRNALARARLRPGLQRNESRPLARRDGGAWLAQRAVKGMQGMRLVCSEGTRAAAAAPAAQAHPACLPPRPLGHLCRRRACSGSTGASPTSSSG